MDDCCNKSMVYKVRVQSTIIRQKINNNKIGRSDGTPTFVQSQMLVSLEAEVIIIDVNSIAGNSRASKKLA